MWQIQVSSERQVRQVQNFLEANVNRPTETNVLGFLWVFIASEGVTLFDYLDNIVRWGVLDFFASHFANWNFDGGGFIQEQTLFFAKISQKTWRFFETWSELSLINAVTTTIAHVLLTRPSQYFKQSNSLTLYGQRASLLLFYPFFISRWETEE